MPNAGPSKRGGEVSVIKSFAVGNGDMFYIFHGSDNFTIIGCCLSDQNKKAIVDEVKSRANTKGITRFISTHPDQDHLSGMVDLDDRMTFVNFYCVANAVTKDPETSDFKRYCELRDHEKKAFNIYKGCTRKWMNLSDDVRSRSGIDILWPDRKNATFIEALERANDGESPNNISPIIKYNLNDGITALWMGDLETDFMEEIEAHVTLPHVDVLFAPHHGRDSGKVPASWLEKMDPGIVVIGEAPSQHLNYYGDYETLTQNSAGNITLDCEAGKVHVYVSSSTYTVDFLENEAKPDTLGRYIGTLQV